MNHTHVKHLKELAYVNGANEVVPTRMTILSRIDDRTLSYQVAFCSRNEKQYVKKIGIDVAKTNPVFTIELSDTIELTNHKLYELIMLDIMDSRNDLRSEGLMPNAHFGFFDALSESIHNVGTRS